MYLLSLRAPSSSVSYGSVWYTPLISRSSLLRGNLISSASILSSYHRQMFLASIGEPLGNVSELVTLLDDVHGVIGEAFGVLGIEFRQILTHELGGCRDDVASFLKPPGMAHNLGQESHAPNVLATNRRWPAKPKWFAWSGASRALLFPIFALLVLLDDFFRLTDFFGCDFLL